MFNMADFINEGVLTEPYGDLPTGTTFTSTLPDITSGSYVLFAGRSEPEYLQFSQLPGYIITK